MYCVLTDDRWLDLRDQNQKHKIAKGWNWKNVNIYIWNLQTRSCTSLSLRFFFFVSNPNFFLQEVYGNFYFYLWYFDISWEQREAWSEHHKITSTMSEDKNLHSICQKKKNYIPTTKLPKYVYYIYSCNYCILQHPKLHSKHELNGFSSLQNGNVLRI